MGKINIFESGNSKFAFNGNDKTCLMGDNDIDEEATKKLLTIYTYWPLSQNLLIIC